MIGITPLAQEKLTAYLAEKKIPLQVRITASQNCREDEDRLILVPDQPAPGDISAHFGPLTLCLGRDLHTQVGRVQVDYRDEGHDFGFVVESERSPANGGGCAGCIACG